MTTHPLLRKLAVLASALMIIGGVWLVLWLFANRPHPSNTAISAAGEATETVAPTPTPILDPLVVELAPLAGSLRAAISETVAAQPALQLATTDAPSVTLRLDWSADGGALVAEQTFAAAQRFNTIFPTTTLSAIQEAWHGETGEFSSVAILSTTLPALAQVLGPPAATVAGYETVAEVSAAVYADSSALALLPFDQLIPKLTVLAVDGQNPVENANHFDPAQYPLVAKLYLHQVQPTTAAEEPVEAALLASMPATNRNPNRLTVLAMTGVTAMCRLTAHQMDKFGYDWPAVVVGPELASADITHISNEVPFVEDCETDTDPSNFNFCSKPGYMATLEAVGADIIGLTGNHQNDFGRPNALKSLDIYAAANLPVYGGGRDAAAANAPFFLTHNGNRLAFLGANSYGPALAWATDDEPGSARFDLDRLSATIRSLHEEDRADLVLVELQYQETYSVNPLIEQRVDFNALLDAGADIVTGVQSHVPQALEFTNGKLILYGLGNLFFDQMDSMPTREGLVVKHTIYNGRHLSTQILTTLIYDYGQPRWTTSEERATLLRRVYAASYWEN
jgi:hypothetical protein